jgi:tetratricopeptide (TPR) repeat protein
MQASGSVRPGLRRAALVALAIVALVAPVQEVAAQPDSGQKPGVSGDKKEAIRRLASGDRHLRRGDRLAERGSIERAFKRFEAALAEYEAAHEAYPDPQIYFPIAQAEQRLGRFVDALAHYQQLLAEPEALSAELRAQVEDRVAEVKKNLAGLVLEVEPDGAAIVIDGDEVAGSPMKEPVYLEPGEHRYRVSKPGYRTAEGALDLPAGEETRRRIELGRDRAEAAAPTSKRAPRTRRPRQRLEREEDDRPSSVPLWIGVGVTSALALGAGATGLATLGKHDQYEDPVREPAERERARRDGQRLATITDILLGGAVLGAGATAYYYFAIHRPRAERADQRERAAVELAPVIGEDLAGVAVSGTFW